MRPALTLLLTAGLVVGLSACNDDGRTLAPAPPPTTAPATPTIDTAGSDSPDQGITTDDVAPVGFALSSPVFINGDLLDPQFSCDGLDVPPPLTISAPPLGAVELAVTVTDRDGDGDVHWVVAGLSPSTTDLDASTLPPTAVFARSSAGTDGWDGPCPPVGDTPHTYDFTVYALPEPLGLTPGLDGAQAVELLVAAASQTATITVFYGRQSGD